MGFERYPTGAGEGGPRAPRDARGRAGGAAPRAMCEARAAGPMVGAWERGARRARARSPARPPRPAHLVFVGRGGQVAARGLGEHGDAAHARHRAGRGEQRGGGKHGRGQQRGRGGAAGRSHGAVACCASCWWVAGGGDLIGRARGGGGGGGSGVGGATRRARWEGPWASGNWRGAGRAAPAPPPAPPRIGTRRCGLPLGAGGGPGRRRGAARGRGWPLVTTDASEWSPCVAAAAAGPSPGDCPAVCALP
jgi:hypothetical protein